MCKTRFGYLFLSWVLLLSLTAGVAIHDHDSSGSGDYACAQDHQNSSHDGAVDLSREASSQWRTAGPLHEHHCLGCHFHSKRSLSRPLQGTATSLDTQANLSFLPATTPRINISLTGVNLRGPPLA